MDMNSSAMLPIREVSKVTGVNPVTLRAWERRYGLIKPHRTSTGHRLYTEANVRQIQDILTWLGRGVAVGQVKQLISSPSDTKDASGSPSLRLIQHYSHALQQFDKPRLNQLFAENMRTLDQIELCREVFEPLLAQLHTRWQGQFGSHIEEAFFYGWWHSTLSQCLQQANGSLDDAPVLLASLSDQHCEADMWLLALMISASGYRVEVVEWEVPASELSLLTDHEAPQALVLFSSQSLQLAQLRRHLPTLITHLPGKLMIAGPAIRIHHQALHALGLGLLEERATDSHARLLDFLGGRQ